MKNLYFASICFISIVCLTFSFADYVRASSGKEIRHESQINKKPSKPPNPLIGEWIQDFEVIKQFYEQSDFAKRIHKSWSEAKLSYIQGGTFEIFFTDKKITYFKDGNKTVSYPYNIEKIVDSWIYIEYVHFLGAKRKLLLKVDGSILSYYYTDTKEWHPPRAFTRKKKTKKY